MATKTTRRMWTDREKAKLIAEFETAPDRRAFLKKHKISSGWFYMMRQKYFRDHPTVVERPAKEAARELSTFAQLPTEEKWRLIAEYDVLPYPEKAAWRERYGLSVPLTTYWRRQLKKTPATPTTKLAQTPSTGKPAPHSPEEAALVAEYKAIPHAGGSKGIWLKAHNLTHQSIHDMRKRAEKAAKPARPEFRQLELTAGPFRGPKRPGLAVAHRELNGHIQQESIPLLPEAPVPTLDDAILSFEVQRDQLNTFIDQLKRMRSGR